MPTPVTTVHRDAVRLLVIDADGRLLLQHCITHAFEPVPGCLSDFERQSIREQRWWRYEDLRVVAAALLNPPELPELLARVRTLDIAAPESDASGAATQ